MKFIVQPVLQGSALNPGVTAAANNSAFTLAAAHTGQVASLRSNGEIIQEQFNWQGEPRQQWSFEPRDEFPGYFAIRSRHSGKVMAVANASQDDGAQIVEEAWNGGQHQQWKVERAGVATVRLTARHSGKAMMVAQDRQDDDPAHYGSLKQGASLVQWSLLANTWRPAPGSLKLKRIEVGTDGEVWGLGPQDQIYRRKGAQWVQVPGTLVQVSVGSSQHIWGVNAAGEVHRWDGSRWARVDGKLMKQVSVGADGTVWAVNAYDEIFVRTGTSWTLVGGRLAQIAVGCAEHVWGINAEGITYRRDKNKWTIVRGRMKQVSVSADGIVLGINTRGEVVRYDGKKWVVISANMVQVSIGVANSTWGVDQANNVHVMNPGLNQQWQLSTIFEPIKAYGYDPRATIYEQENYTGRSQELGIGSYDIGDLKIGNDRLSSLKVPHGLRVTLYQDANFKGATRAYTGDTATVGDFGDKTSGILVEPVVTLYQGENYTGLSQQFGVGAYRVAKLNVIGSETISSIKVPFGLIAVLYEGNYFNGPYRSFTWNSTSVGDDFIKKTSSLIVKALGIEIPIGTLQYGDKVLLSSCQKKYLSANGSVAANQDAVTPEAELIITRTGPTRYTNYVCYGDTIGLKTSQGKYLAVDASQQVVAEQPADVISKAEKWVIVRSGNSISQMFVAPGDTLSLLAANERYMGIKADSRLTVDCMKPNDSLVQWTVRTPTRAVGAYNTSGGGGCAVVAPAFIADGVCPSDVCGVAACGADSCGAAACGAAGSLVAVCGAAAAIIALCGADACGAALAVAGACGAAATGAGICGAALGGLSICAADGCGAAGCAAAACGAAGCAAAACAAAACGAAVCAGDASPVGACGIQAAGVRACGAQTGAINVCGALACGADACAINACPADACAADACAIDVIPIIPGI